MSDLNRVEVVPIKLEKHPNADTLSIVKVWNYTVVVRTSDWEGKTKAAYIAPDNLVPIEKPEFSFLNSPRIKTKRLRGVMSQGILVPVPDEFPIGKDVTEYFGVTRYVSPVDMEIGGDVISGPPNKPEKYDLQSWYKYGSVLESICDKDFIVITEKVDGTNASFTFQDGQMWCKSRSLYRKSNVDSTGVELNIYWKALRENTWIENFCKDFQNHHLFGEIYGWVQENRYSHPPGKISFVAFDILDPNGNFFEYEKFKDVVSYYGGVIAPELYIGKYDAQRIEELIDGPSLIDPTVKREGIVIRCIREKQCVGFGRSILKAVSPEYLEGKK
jgi:RNA ligase (TIGR02306 family)